MTAYTKIRSLIKRELAEGERRLRQTFNRQLLVTHWRVGQVIEEQVMKAEPDAARRRRLIRRLAADFGRNDSFFYMLAKLYRLYPVLPDNGLTWSHYIQLLSVDDEQKRLRYARLAADSDMPILQLRDLVRGGRDGTRGLLVPDAPGGRLSCRRGRLYHYRVMLDKRIPPVPGRIKVDVGFHIRRGVKTRLASPQQGRLVRAEKDGEEYWARAANAHPEWLYTYTAHVERVVDGDTVLAHIDLGFRTWIKQKLRLRGIDCAEKGTVAGERARKFVEGITRKAPFAVVKTYKDDKYGRMLADVFLADGDMFPSPQGTKRVPGSEPRGANRPGRGGLPQHPQDPDPAQVAEKGIFLNQLLLDNRLARLWKD